MQSGKPQDRPAKGSIQPLWKRAPAFRRVVYGAGVVSLIGAIAFALNQMNSAPESPAHEPLAMTLAAPEKAPILGGPGNSDGPLKAMAKTGASVPSPASEGAAPAVQTSIIRTSETAPDGVAQENARLARCHPHLIPGSTVMPQIDVSRMADPSVGHIKVHFWVNGAGSVTREVLTGTSYATPAELQAELGFTKNLTFKVPDTIECRTREIELVGDYFEMKGVSGSWATFVKLYPRLSFDSDGVVQSRD